MSKVLEIKKDKVPSNFLQPKTAQYTKKAAFLLN